MRRLSASISGLEGARPPPVQGAQGLREAADRDSMRRATALGSTVLAALALAGAARAVRPDLPSSTVVRRPRARGRTRRSRSSRPPASSAATRPTFRPADPLTRGELADALAAWGKPATVPADPSKLVTISELDAQLVNALGLTPAARRIRLAAARRSARADVHASAPRRSRGCSGSGSTIRRARTISSCCRRSPPPAPRPPTPSPGRYRSPRGSSPRSTSSARRSRCLRSATGSGRC